MAAEEEITENELDQKKKLGTKVLYGDLIQVTLHCVHNTTQNPCLLQCITVSLLQWVSNVTPATGSLLSVKCITMQALWIIL